MSEESFIQHDVENKQLRKENEKLNVNENENEKQNVNENESEKLNVNENENKNENENQNKKLKKKIVKDANRKESVEEPKEIKSPNWFDKNKFKEILTIIDSNKFGPKNKIGEFKYMDLKDLVNNIKDNTISGIDAKKRLNTLNKIKNAKIKYKRLIHGQKELLNLFNDLSDMILTDKTLMSSKNENKTLKEEQEN